MTIQTGAAAPDFTLEDPAGRQMSLKELRGKVVFLNFWATWCPPCIQEMPTMEKLHQEMEKAGLVILAIDFHGKVSGYRDWHGEEAKAFFRGLLAEQL